MLIMKLAIYTHNDCLKFNQVKKQKEKKRINVKMNSTKNDECHDIIPKRGTFFKIY